MNQQLNIIPNFKVIIKNGPHIKHSNKENQSQGWLCSQTSKYNFLNTTYIKV